jgi:hypothetical protein
MSGAGRECTQCTGQGQNHGAPVVWGPVVWTLHAIAVHVCVCMCEFACVQSVVDVSLVVLCLRWCAVCFCPCWAVVVQSRACRDEPCVRVCMCM